MPSRPVLTSPGNRALAAWVQREEKADKPQPPQSGDIHELLREALRAEAIKGAADEVVEERDLGPGAPEPPASPATLETVEEGPASGGPVAPNPNPNPDTEQQSAVREGKPSDLVKAAAEQTGLRDEVDKAIADVTTQLRQLPSAAQLGIGTAVVGGTLAGGIALGRRVSVKPADWLALRIDLDRRNMVSGAQVTLDLARLFPQLR